MSLGKKTIVAVGLIEGLTDALKSVREMNFLHGSEVHFVHVFNSINYSTVVSEFPLVYPIQADLTSIEKVVMDQLIKTSKEILPPDFNGKVVHKVLFDESPKSRFCEYVKDTHADLVIIAKRRKRGIFESSFGQYVSRHTDANVILLKTQ